ncbi:cell wall metabolism sensor histidine kinase WalK [Terriglobus sp. TAA 43]|uniref:sensor histidine kinase n=1 Tax=Terriglobus sp. TAA 43 TaxID=278961 RepID=UPI000647B84C|nr:ATP-binding protein [Terriglobus sp. TAA 43]
MQILSYLSRKNIALRSFLSVLFISGLIGALAPLHRALSVTTIGFTLLLGVLFISIHMGSKPALAASVVAMLGYNFFFLPPLLTLTIEDPQNWVALAAFSITAVVTGQLSAHARQRALEAEEARLESERLYRELRSAFEIASQTEAIKRSEQMKSALLDAVTHDLRTPLTSIRAAATTLRKAYVSGQHIESELEEELIGMVDEESLHLDQLISSFVELARVESGHMLLKTSWSSLQDVTGAAIKRAERMSGEHAIVVEIPDTLPLLNIDERALSEVVYTLIDNAKKYSPPRSKVTVTARMSESGIEVWVHDEGIGIAAADATRVFQKFYRGDETRVSTPHGLGVGLAIAKAIVEAHGGVIWVDQPGGATGTTIKFHIPVREENVCLPNQ